MPSSIVQAGPSCDPALPAPLLSYSASVPGGREYNEDRYFSCDQSRLYLVVDGMGGHVGGALASQITVETIPAEFYRRLSKGPRCDTEILCAYQGAIDETVREMANVCCMHPEYNQMGCTLAAVFVAGDRAYFGNLGDCRVYLLRRNKLSSLTRDQTLVQDLIDRGLLAASSARTHRWRHIVTNGVGAEGVRQTPQLAWIARSPGDRLMICSDGLCDALEDEQIRLVMNESNDPESCVEGLIEEALDHDARDNVTCTVIQV